MIKNYLIIAVRNLLQKKVYSFINILGLAMGIGFCNLTFIYIRHELTFDTFHKAADQIYRVISISKNPKGENDVTALGPNPLGPSLVDHFPGIKRSVRFFSWGGFINYEDQTFKEQFLFSDPSIFEMFSFPMLKGNPNNALRDPNSVVMTQESAERYFGDGDPIGRNISIKLRETFQEFLVTGVTKNTPKNSTIKFDFLIPFGKISQLTGGDANWMGRSIVTYIQLSDIASLSNLEKQLPRFVEIKLGPTIEMIQKAGYYSLDEDAFRLDLQPLNEVHLGSNITTFEPIGNPTHLYIITGIALLILLIACINFMNISLGLSSTRAREIVIRKVVGATRVQLMKQFLGESLLLSFVAMLFGNSNCRIYSADFQ